MLSKVPGYLITEHECSHNTEDFDTPYVPSRKENLPGRRFPDAAAHLARPLQALA
jgi:hypothetical protein